MNVSPNAREAETLIARLDWTTTPWGQPANGRKACAPQWTS